MSITYIQQARSMNYEHFEDEETLSQQQPVIRKTITVEQTQNQEQIHAAFIQSPRIENKFHTFEAYIIHFTFGIFGGLHFRMGRPIMGLIYLFTIGGLGFGWMVDCFRIQHLVTEYNQKHSCWQGYESDLTLIGDSYALWLLGFGGANHFYLKRYGWGIFYLCTCGGFGIGWIVDLIRIPGLVRSYQSKTSEVCSKDTFLLSDAYILLIPWGLFGVHYIYLKDYKMFLLYFFTCGLLGIGFLVDFIRIPQLVREANGRNSRGINLNRNIVDATLVV